MGDTEITLTGAGCTNEGGNFRRGLSSRVLPTDAPEIAGVPKEARGTTSSAAQAGPSTPTDDATTDQNRVFSIFLFLSRAEEAA